MAENQSENGSLGSRLRSRRQQEGYKLIDFAEKCGISSSFLSQIERDQANPSISTLHEIAAVLGVPLAFFFTNEEETSQKKLEQPREDSGATVVRANQRKQLIYPGSGIRNELLSPDLNRAIQMMWVVIPPGAETGPEPLVHDGEECGFILQGNVEIWSGNEHFVLGPGDSIYQDSSIPHHSRNIGDEDVIVVVAITPPSF